MGVLLSAEQVNSRRVFLLLSLPFYLSSVNVPICSAAIPQLFHPGSAAFHYHSAALPPGSTILPLRSTRFLHAFRSHSSEFHINSANFLYISNRICKKYRVFFHKYITNTKPKGANLTASPSDHDKTINNQPSKYARVAKVQKSSARSPGFPRLYPGSSRFAPARPSHRRKHKRREFLFKWSRVLIRKQNVQPSKQQYQPNQ